MKILFRLLFIALTVPTLLGGCASHKIKSQAMQQKVHQKKLYGNLTRDELDQINRQWNLLVTYKEDSLEDHWQSPAETLALKTGDCEDIAIAKMFDPTLHRAIPAAQLRLGYVHTPAGLPHMVLIVGQGDAALVLDNLVDDIRTLAESGYRPAYQLDANGQVYRDDRLLVSHPRFEKFELILAEFGMFDLKLAELEPDIAY
ncbi:transglutaminase-like cysteine peptidase [Sedimenticola hydrogenitrophicus]|uniref:transglutaminase-like cysteine peptidase n=1 Tax=Sedimenticola hydrogenitrophicus TaxID=2967975 RepID=UPI0023B18801|nr:transglutaminase-like cysteine peptidase [Sedimenticola hydrogenitrophicus]